MTSHRSKCLLPSIHPFYSAYLYSDMDRFYSPQPPPLILPGWQKSCSQSSWDTSSPAHISPVQGLHRETGVETSWQPPVYKLMCICWLPESGCWRLLAVRRVKLVTKWNAMLHWKPPSYCFGASRLSLPPVSHMEDVNLAAKNSQSCNEVVKSATQTTHMVTKLCDFPANLHHFSPTEERSL